MQETQGLCKQRKVQNTPLIWHKPYHMENSPYVRPKIHTSQTCQVSRTSCETHSFSVKSCISTGTEIISLIFHTDTHNFYARFLQEIDNTLQLITTRQPVQV